MRLHVCTELIEAARNGASADVERLLEAVWPDAYRLARAIILQSQAAEDAAQEACVTVYRRIASLRSAQAFPTWFYRIVARQALKHKKAQEQLTTLPADMPYSDDRSGVLDLWRALATLPEQLRAVIVLHYFEDLSSREIAGILHVPDPTVRFRLMNARRRLQRLLGDNQGSTQKEDGEMYAL